MAIGILPGDTIIITDSYHNTSWEEVAKCVVEKVSYCRERVYVSGSFGIVDFPKYAKIVVVY